MAQHPQDMFERQADHAIARLPILEDVADALEALLISLDGPADSHTWVDLDTAKRDAKAALAKARGESA